MRGSTRRRWRCLFPPPSRPGPRRGSAAVRHAGEERQVADADTAGALDLLIRVHREGDHAVDVAGSQPCVVNGGFDCLASELELAAPGLLRKFGLADTGDGRPSSQQTHASTLSSSRLSVAVPDTCAPRLFVPLKAMSAKSSPPTPSDLPVTVAVKRSGS